MIWWYPNSTRADGGGEMSIAEIDLDEPFGALEPDVLQVGSNGEAINGGRSQVIQSNRIRVRMFIDRATNAETVAALYSLESHLRRNGVIAVANRAAKAWAGFATRMPAKGETSVRTGGNPWSGLSGGTQQVAAGDEVWISSASPESMRHVGIVDSAAFGTVDRVTLTQPITYSPALAPVLVRHRDFYPALVALDPFQDEPMVRMIANGRGVTVDVDLVEHLPTIARASTVSAGYYSRRDNGGSF